MVQRAKGKPTSTRIMELFRALLLCSAIVQLKLVSITACYSSPNCSAKAESRRDVEKVCTNEEYYRKTGALFCQMSYLTTLKEGIQQSSCKVNVGDDIHFEKTSPPCKFPEDERHDVRYNCSEDCSRRFLHFLFCTTIGKQYADVSQECGITNSPHFYCGFDKGDFCVMKYNKTKSLLEQCSPRSDGHKIVCSQSCKMAVETYAAECGCCVDYWKSYDENGGTKVSDILSACEMGVPDRCNVDYNPPRGILHCARDESAIDRSAANLASLMIVLVSAKIGLAVGL